jgi:hypothetical protein
VELVADTVYQSTVAGPLADEQLGVAPPCPAPMLEPLSANGVRGHSAFLTAMYRTSSLNGCRPRICAVSASAENTRAPMGREKE